MAPNGEHGGDVHRGASSWKSLAAFFLASVAGLYLILGDHWVVEDPKRHPAESVSRPQARGDETAATEAPALYVRQPASATDAPSEASDAPEALSLQKKQVVIVEQKHQYICSYMETRKDSSDVLKAAGYKNGCVAVCPSLNARGGQCLVVVDVNDHTLGSADAIVYHPGRGLPVVRTKKTQWTAMWYGESKEKHPEKYTPQYLAQYDAHVVYEGWSSYRFSWTQRFRADFEAIEDAKKAWIPWHKRRTAAAVVSNCKYHTTNRTEVMHALDTLIRKHSGGEDRLYLFGSCHPGRNKDSISAEHPECKSKKKNPSATEKYREKMCVLRRYRYVISIDNSRDASYVTEKVYHSLISGAVPIYAGAANIDGFVPLPSSILQVDPAADLDPIARRLTSKEDKRTPPPEQLWHTLTADQWSPAFLANLRLPNPACTMCADIAAGIKPRDSNRIPSA